MYALLLTLSIPFNAFLLFLLELLLEYSKRASKVLSTITSILCESKSSEL